MATKREIGIYVVAIYIIYFIVLPDGKSFNTVLQSYTQLQIAKKKTIKVHLKFYIFNYIFVFKSKNKRLH